MKKNIAVYTCITGNCNQIASIKHREKNIDYYCFTNNKDIKSDDWNIVYIDDKDLSNEILLKKYKILGIPKIEEKYDIVIFVDRNIQIETSFKEIISKYCDFSKESVFFLKNSEMNCTYQLGKQYISSNLEHPSIIKNQLKFYSQEKFPEKYGMISTNIIIRKSKNYKLLKMQKQWYNQILNFSENEQLSIMYSLWKQSISYGVIDLELYNNSIFSLLPYSDTKKSIVNCIFGSGLYNTLGLIEEKNKYEPEKENYICHIDDKNDSHSIIARKVKNGSTVLDIGCGVGIIGRLLYNNKNCINYGIEIDKESFEIAKKTGYYKEIYNISIENEEEWKRLLNKKLHFDYIILADVLEHLKNPCCILENLISLLNKDGKILISIPNVAYIDIIRALIDREFNYQKTGILDSTHFRFFTKKSFAEMIDNFNSLHDVNFDVDCFDSTKVSPEYSDSLLTKMLNVDEEATVVQNIFELTQISSSQIPEKLIKLLKENQKSNYSIIEKKIEQEIQSKEESRLKIQLLNQKSEQLETEKNMMSQKIEKLDSDNSFLKDELKKVFDSKSWKITAPLRNFIKIVKNSK